jgi:hypothetical protein
MAVEQVGAGRREWQGFSTDDKPQTNIPAGAKYLSVDTGERWRMFNGAWIIDLESVNVLRDAMA